MSVGTTGSRPTCWGLLVERVTGQRFDQFLREHVLAPLCMNDTTFELTGQQTGRFTSLYTPDETTGGLRGVETADESRYARGVSTFSGGGGLLSCAADYHRFTQMLLNGGELDGTRLLGRKTVDYMVVNHLPGDLADMGSGFFQRNELPPGSDSVWAFRFCWTRPRQRSWVRPASLRGVGWRALRSGWTGRRR